MPNQLLTQAVAQKKMNKKEFKREWRDLELTMIK